MKYRYLSILILTFFLVQCNVDREHDDQSEEQEMEAHDENEVELSRIQIENIGLKYGKLTPRKIESTLKLTGRIEMPASGKSVAGSNLDGKVKKVYVLAGDYIRKGQPLFTIENMEIIDWQQQLAAARADQTYLSRELARQKELSEESISPVKKYESTLAEVGRLNASIRALETKLRSIGLATDVNGEFRSTFVITAPSSGTLQHLMVNIGEYIDATTHLAEIVNNDHLHIHLIAYGADVAIMEKGQRIKFFVQSRPDQLLDAEVKWINSIVDETTNSYDVHAEIVSPTKGLIAGEFVEARIINEEREVNSLPITAITNDKGIDYIFIREEEHEDAIHFRKVKILTGEQDLGFIEVKPVDPFALTSDVVVDGAYFLMAHSKKDEEGGGHEH